jgi:gentisate 1,2-dioxygenase/2-polyprenyl-6-methoxyphenol hydroxylase-like FAD-dependent oxidoreductase
MPGASPSLPILVAGGGIGGLAAALALARQGFAVKVLEQASQIGEIGAGIQLGPNAFSAFDALGVGERARSRAVYTDRLVLMDAVDEAELASLPVGEPFRARFGNPYAVSHRADVHRSLLEGVQAAERIELCTSTQVDRIEQDAAGVTAIDRAGRRHLGAALVACDGVKSTVRQQLIGDPVRVSGHVVYRAVVDDREFPADLKWNAPCVWAGPDCHLVHYPLRGGEQWNVVVTFHSRGREEWGVTDGSRDEVMAYFDGISARPRQLLALPRSWRRWATADRDPIARWTFGRVTLLGDAAHPMLQYLAQGACMALEDAVALGEAVRSAGGDLELGFVRYEQARVARTARVVLMAREMGRIYHAKGVERLVRNDLWRGRAPARWFDAVEWLYGWRVDAAAPAASAAAPAGPREQFYRRIEPHSLAPLWTRLKALVPREPTPTGVAHRWRYADVRPHVLEAAAHITAAEAERRVLILENPGLRGSSQITGNLYAGLQLIMPGETAPPHRHTQSALRFIVEGDGAYTTVDDDQVVMRPGDLVITPAWRWHQHGNRTERPMVWLDGLDIPLAMYLGATFREDAHERAAAGAGTDPAPLPPIHFPYAQSRAALEAMRHGGPPDPHLGYLLRYRDPATGGWVMPTIATMLRLLPAGFTSAPYRSSDSMVFVAVEGRGAIDVAGARFELAPHDVAVVPGWLTYAIRADDDLVVFSYSERAAQDRLGLFREQRL